MLQWLRIPLPTFYTYLSGKYSVKSTSLELFDVLRHMSFPFKGNVIHEKFSAQQHLTT